MSDTDSNADTSSVSGDVEDLARRVEVQVSGAEEPVTIGELAARVNEEGAHAGDDTADVHEQLHDRVLPDLESDGFVDFDVDTGVVRPIHERGSADGSRLRRGASRFRGRSALAVPVLLGGATALYTGSPLPTLGVSATGLGVLYLLGLLTS